MAQNSSKSSKAKLKSRSVACVSNKHRKTSPRWASDGPFSYDALKRLAGWLRPFIAPTLVVFGICCLSLISVMRSGMPYVDDISRNYHDGYAFSTAFNRYSSSFLSYLLNTDIVLQNLSPWTQIVAMGIVSVAIVVMVYNLCGRSIKWLPLIAGTVVAVNPLALGCWMFIYDSPGMALAVLSSVLPICFWYRLMNDDVNAKQRRRTLIGFIIASTTSLLVMWTSYQAMSGFLPVLVVSMLFISIVRNQRVRQSLRTALWYVVPYLVAAGLFYFVLPAPSGYRSTSISSLRGLVPTVWHNLSNYVVSAAHGLNKVWLILIILVVVAFAVSVTRYVWCRRRRWAWSAPLLSLAFLVIIVPLSHGAYILLAEQAEGRVSSSQNFGRTAVGWGMVLAMMLIITTSLVDRIKWSWLGLPGLVLLYSFINYSIAYGNAYKEQFDYSNYRLDEAMYDIARVDGGREEEKQVLVYGDIGKSQQMQKLWARYPAAGLITTPHGFELWLMPDSVVYARQFYRNVHIVPNTDSFDQKCAAGELRGRTYYHDIRETDDAICVLLK